MAAFGIEYEAGELYWKVEKAPRSDVWVTQKLSDCTTGEVLKHKVFTISRPIIVLCHRALTEKHNLLISREKKLI